MSDRPRSRRAKWALFVAACSTACLYQTVVCFTPDYWNSWYYNPFYYPWYY